MFTIVYTTQKFHLHVTFTATQLMITVDMKIDSPDCSVKVGVAVNLMGSRKWQPRMKAVVT